MNYQDQGQAQTSPKESKAVGYPDCVCKLCLEQKEWHRKELRALQIRSHKGTIVFGVFVTVDILVFIILLMIR